MKTFFTSDHHFNHKNIISFCSRPWQTVSEMNEILIKNWNETVSPDDIVYYLGDFAVGSRDEIPKLLARLNGKIILIRGNHDYDMSLKHFVEHYNNLSIDIDGVKIELVHNPSHAKWDCDFVLCGHIHNTWKMKNINEIIPGDVRRNQEISYHDTKAQKYILNVGVDVNNFRPISINEVLNLYEETKNKK